TRNFETRLTTGQAVQMSGGNNEYGPVWSPDGKQVAYSSGNGIYVKDIDGATDAKLIDFGHHVNVTDWTRDGRFLIYDDSGGIGEAPGRGGHPIPVVAAGAHAWRGRISPDSHWIAYESATSGGPVYVRPYALPGSGTAPAGPVIQISRGGASGPMWSSDG